MPASSDSRRIQLDPHILDFLTAFSARGGPPLWTLSPASAHEALLSLQRSITVTELPVDSADCTLLAGPTGRIGLRIARPHGASGVLPAVMYFHGGGWVLGDAETHDRLVCEIATGAQATVVFVEYARSPQAKREFKMANPCPSTGRSSGACPGYVIDHVTPLKRGGSDAPANMQWQTVEAAKLKDRWE